MVKRQSYALQVSQPKSQAVQTSPKQVKNDAGGFVYEADQWVRLNRFMILGTESDSYYVGAEQKTFEAYAVIQSCIKADGKRVVDLAVEISQGGYAPKNDAAIWVLSMACAPKYATPDVTKYALEHVYLVCRTLAHLYQFVDMMQQSRGWSRGTRRSIAKWFEFMGFHGAAYQSIKYRQRNGWTGRDILRLGHVPIINAEMNAIFRWLTGSDVGAEHVVKRITKTGGRTDTYPPLHQFLPPIIMAYTTVQVMQASGAVTSTQGWEKGSPSENPLESMMGGLAPVVQAETVEAETIRLIEKFGLTWEMLPTQMLNSAAIWAALIPHMPYTALQRNLATMTRAGVFANKAMVKLVTDRLKDADAIKKARIHPINLLAAQMTYAQGKGMRGGNTWEPVRQITEALDEAFPLAFKAVEATGLNILIGIDVSSSMLHYKVNGMDYLSASQGATALAVALLGIEPNADSMLFDGTYHHSELSPRNTLVTSMMYIGGFRGDSTDCAAPFLYAIDQLDNGKISRMYDAVILLTDTQTWAGETHTDHMIAECRKRNPQMRVVEVALEANKFTTEDKNPLTLQIAGLDSSAPKLITAFLQGKV